MLRIYYLDRPLDEIEVAVANTLMAHFKGYVADSVEQVRIPMVLPAPSSSGTLGMSLDEQMDFIHDLLLMAGLGREIGSQVVFVMPDEVHWGVKFQSVIMDMTGFFPYVVQRCVPGDEGKPAEARMRIIDGDGLMYDG